MKTFYHILANTLLATLTNNFLWFALVFWAYLETRSVLATSIIGGLFMLISALLGVGFGTFVDRHKKKTAMLCSSATSLAAFGLAALLYVVVPQAELLTLSSVQFWLFAVLVLVGALAGNLRTIALSTTVSLLLPKDRHARANGMVGTVNGVAFVITSVFSGFVIGWFGMGAALCVAITLTLATIVHMAMVTIKENLPQVDEESKSKMDIQGALKAVCVIPGLLGLIYFTCFNNFVSGVFFSLIDPYGLTLVPVEIWGVLLGILSTGFIIGGVVVSKKGLGTRPLRMLFLSNIAILVTSLLFPLAPSVALLCMALFVYNFLFPVVEASEQTIIQRVVPYAKQGRVFGFAQGVENAAAPITAFLIGPVAQFLAIPFMTDGAGARTIGGWFGTGANRGMALVFVVAAAIGLVVALLAMRSRAYRNLSKAYAES